MTGSGRWWPGRWAGQRRAERRRAERRRAERRKAWRPRRAGWTPGRVWGVWLVGHAIGVVSLAVAYLVDGSSSVPHDIRIYAEWGVALAAGDGLPVGDDRWQYPPAAAVVLAAPAVVERFVGIAYPVGFVVGILALDAAVTAVLLRRHSAAAAGLWALGADAVGQVAFTRFDMVPAGLAVLALLAATGRRWAPAGAALGAGALVKVWPVLLLAAFGRCRRGPHGSGPAATAGGADGDENAVAVAAVDGQGRAVVLLAVKQAVVWRWATGGRLAVAPGAVATAAARRGATHARAARAAGAVATAMAVRAMTLVARCGGLAT